jgi:ADP-ribose pyrophosphatase
MLSNCRLSFCYQSQKRSTSQKGQLGMSQFTAKDITVLKTETLFKGFFKMVKYTFTHKKYDGTQSDVVQREVFERGHAAAVLAYDKRLEEFVLIEQFRYPAMATSDHPWMIEIIAGIIEPGEHEVDVCKREAFEEAGVELVNVTKALSYLSSPDASKAGGIHGLANEAEDIKVLRVPEKQAIQWLEQGKIDNAAAVIALQWFILNKQSLLSRWRS